MILIQKDPKVTAISVDGNHSSAAQGSVVTDEDGVRQATVIFPAGTKVIKGYKRTQSTFGPPNTRSVPMVRR